MFPLMSMKCPSPFHLITFGWKSTFLDMTMVSPTWFLGEKGRTEQMSGRVERKRETKSNLRREGGRDRRWERDKGEGGEGKGEGETERDTEWQKQTVRDTETEIQRQRQGLAWGFETPKHTSSDIPPPARTYLLVFLKQFHELGSKHSNIWAFESHFYSNHSMYDTEDF